VPARRSSYTCRDSSAVSDESSRAAAMPRARSDLHLVLISAMSGEDDQRHALHQHCGQLIAERLPRAGGEERQGAAAGEQSLDDLCLPGTKRRVAECFAERVVQGGVGGGSSGSGHGRLMHGMERPSRICSREHYDDMNTLQKVMLTRL